MPCSTELNTSFVKIGLDGICADHLYGFETRGKCYECGIGFPCQAQLNPISSCDILESK